MLNLLVYVVLWFLDLKVVKFLKIVFYYSKILFYGFGFIFCYVFIFLVYFVVVVISVFVDKIMFFIFFIFLCCWIFCNEGCGSWIVYWDFVRMYYNFFDFDFCLFSSDVLVYKIIIFVIVWIFVYIIDVLECLMLYMLLFLWYVVCIVIF